MLNVVSRSCILLHPPCILLACLNGAADTALCIYRTSFLFHLAEHSFKGQTGTGVRQRVLHSTPQMSMHPLHCTWPAQPLHCTATAQPLHSHCTTTAAPSSFEIPWQRLHLALSHPVPATPAISSATAAVYYLGLSGQSFSISRLDQLPVGLCLLLLGTLFPSLLRLES